MENTCYDTECWDWYEILEAQDSQDWFSWSILKILKILKILMIDLQDQFLRLIIMIVLNFYQMAFY